MSPSRRPPPERREPQFGYRGDQPYAGQAGPRRGFRLLRVLVTGCAVILFVGLVVVSYRRHPAPAPGQLPVIAADQSPVKVAPDHPGGMDIPFKDTTVYDELAGGKNKQSAGTVEHILQPQEEPMPKPQAGEAAPPAPAGDAPDESQDSVMPLIQPPPLPADAKPQLPPPMPPTAVVAPPPTTGLAGPSGPPPATVPAGNFAIQLGAFHDAATANGDWQKLQAAHGALLTGFSPTVTKVDLGAKGVLYRLKAGPMDEAHARQICTTLKASNAACIVVPK